jgi:hypothetical protein
MANKADFIAQIYRAGIAAGLTDAAARITATQAGIESNYGERAPGFNYFGITKGNDWNGPTISRPDKDANGNPVTQQFRVYASPEAGVADRVAYMRVHFPAFNAAPTQDKALEALQKGTYGVYYTAPRADYEAAVAKVQKAYLPATVTVSHPVPPGMVPNAAPGVPKIIDLTEGGTVGGQRIPKSSAAQLRAASIKGVVFHHTAGSSLSGALQAGTKNKGATYYIDTDGAIYRYTPDNVKRIGIRDPGDSFRTDVGKPTYGLTNDNTISVEVVAPDSEHFSQAQQAAAAQLGGYLASTYHIDPSMIVGHGDIQGGAGGNKMPTEGVSLAAYVRAQASTSALQAIEQVAPRGVSSTAMAYTESGTRGALARLNQMRLDQAKREAYQSAAFGVREAGIGEGGGGPGPVTGTERGKLKPPSFEDYGTDVTDLSGTLASGTYAAGAFDDPSLLHGGGLLADDIGFGPLSWFDASSEFGSTVVASSGAVPLPRERPPTPVPVVTAPVPMPGRPTSLDPIEAAPVPRQRPPSVSAATIAEQSAAPAPAPAAPPPRMVKLKSGKMVQTGTYTDPKTGTRTVITAGPNGEAVQETYRQGLAGDLGGGLAGKFLGDAIKQHGGDVAAAVGDKLGEATTAVGSQLGQATETVKSTIGEQAAHLGDNLSGLGSKLGSFFGIGQGPVTTAVPSPSERLRNIMDVAVRHGEILLPTDHNGDPVIASRPDAGMPRQPQPAIWATPLRLKSVPLADTGHVGASLDRAFPKLEDIHDRQAQRAADAVSTSTVKPVKAAPAPVVKPAASPIGRGTLGVMGKAMGGGNAVRTVTELKPNPDYARWEKSQTVNPVAVSTLQDIHDREADRLAPAGAVSGMTAAAGGVAGLIPKPVEARAPAPLTPAPPKYIPVRRVITQTGNAQAGQTQVAAVAAPRPKPTVTIASGRTVAVGTRGTSQGGRYVYEVQADGSVRNITTGRTTSPAPARNSGSSNPSATHWDAASGGWSNNA